MDRAESRAFPGALRGSHCAPGQAGSRGGRAPGRAGRVARVNLEKRTEIFMRLRAANPSPTTELQYRTPFELLIAVILSAQATDKGVNLATPALFRAADTPAKMHKLGVEKLMSYIKTIGLYRSKA